MKLEEMIHAYLERGFGSMTKNDFEVWIFNYLLQNELQGKSDNAISRELRIPSAKVKRLRYERLNRCTFYITEIPYFKFCNFHFYSFTIL